MPNWTRNELEIQFHNVSEDTKERRKSVKDFLKKVTVEEVDRRNFVFNKMLTGDKGDAVPGVWYTAAPGLRAAALAR